MELDYTDEHIKFEKKLNHLDNFVMDFTKVLEDHDLKYVLIAGYVAILFGRSRESEDIDIFIENLPLEKFKALWTALETAGFECIITNSPEQAYEDYLQAKLSVRWSYKDEFIPNMEVKFPKDKDERWNLMNRRKVILNGTVLYISPIESQIAYKLDSASKKDIEDASYLYLIFEEYIDKAQLHYFYDTLDIPRNMQELIK